MSTLCIAVQLLCSLSRLNGYVDLVEVLISCNLPYVPYIVMDHLWRLGPAVVLTLPTVLHVPQVTIRAALRGTLSLLLTMVLVTPFVPAFTLHLALFAIFVARLPAKWGD